jgi:hypothetical protein
MQFPLSFTIRSLLGKLKAMVCGPFTSCTRSLLERHEAVNEDMELLI